ncbi:hypothetical protein EU527_19785 [Candidatus Thorarchaeota archaeon]|nr:MAG: hypothetical protein EU527_19785 [Candidatus Thorarchaeota archaeon]
MRQTEQAKLSEFEESNEATDSKCPKIEKVHSTASSISVSEFQPPRPKGQMWYKTIKTEENWGVCNFDGTVLFVQLINGRIHAHSKEAVCKWCGSILEIREDKIFCNGRCKRYQGDFSRDLSDFLRWEGAKSYTLRKIVAEVEKLELESRDLEPIAYAPNWSILYEYADEMESDDDSTYDLTD